MAATHEPPDRDQPTAPREYTPRAFGRVLGASPATRTLIDLLQRAAASEATVLLEGETGTGKEVSATAIHEHSARRAGPFIVVDCGAIPAQLLESELFGYERGAFTGAVGPRAGAFEAAHGGSIFLDEIGELSIDLQPKILRALESRKVKRVGSNHYTQVDVRVIAATNRSLRDEVREKRFRSDLYYRLAVLHVRLPPLRERLEDLPVLVDDVLVQLGQASSPQAEELRSPEFLARLASLRWRGNVRQLRNYLERHLALGEAASADTGETMMPPPALQTTEAEAEVLPVHLPLKEARELWTSRFEFRYLEALLAMHGGNVASAARAAGVHRVHFYRLLWKHGLRAAPGSEPTDLGES